MVELFLMLIVIGATFAAGAYYGRAEEQKIVAAIVADVKADATALVASVRARVAAIKL